MTDTRQQVPSTIQWFGRTLKSNNNVCTGEVWDENPDKWSYILNSVLFAYRVSSHSSTKYSQFYLMYNN